jgi:hypothetical protein
VCLGHFLAWLDASGLRISDCGDTQLADYERTLAGFRPGPRIAHLRTAHEFVSFAGASSTRENDDLIG